MAGKDIIKFRKRFGLSREDLASKVGVSLSTIWRWEHNQAKSHKVLEAKLKKIMRGYTATEGGGD